MKRILLLMVVAMVVASCRTRRKTSVSRYTASEKTEFVKKDSSVVVKDTVKRHVEKAINSSVRESIVSSEINIKGKTDSASKVFTFHDVVSGDTVQSFYISGNAEFIIKGKRRTSDAKTVVSEKKDSLNVVARLARTAVAQSTLKKNAEVIRQLDKQVVQHGLPKFWIIIIFAGLFVVIAALSYFYMFQPGAALSVWKIIKSIFFK